MKNQSDIEQALQSLAPSASGFDKAGIKARLMTEITAAPAQSASILSLYRWYVRSLSLGLATFVCMFVGSAYFSLAALPGDALYSMKVNVTEEMIAFTKRTPEAAFEYSVERISLRTHELEAILVLDEAVPADVVLEVHDQIAEEVETIEAIVTNPASTADTEQYLPDLAQAKRIIHEHGDTVSVYYPDVADSFDSVEERIATSLTEEIQSYMETAATSTVSAFVSEQIAYIDDVLLATTTPQDIRELSTGALADMYTSIERNELEDAVTKVLELSAIIETEVTEPEEE